MIDISVSRQEVQVDLLSNKIKTNLKNFTNLNHWLSLNEHLFQGADTLFKVLHGHLDDHANQTTVNQSSGFTLLAPPEVIALVNSETSWSNLFQQTHRVSALAWIRWSSFGPQVF